MNHTYPSIKVVDIETTIKWYEDFLGFQCTYKSSLKNPDSAVIEKESQKIYLLKEPSPGVYTSNTIIFETSDLEAEYKSLEKAGVIITQPIGNGFFSENEFEIKDYEDNRLIYIKKI